MRDEKLREILLKINLEDCKEVIPNHLYHINYCLKQRVYGESGKYTYDYATYEFIVIAKDRIKQAIILRCGYEDLHWHVLKKYRGMHVLSNALRTGIIAMMWPENKSVTCCCNYYEDYETKYEMTKHLADLAGLRMAN